ncbi:hypothetical protein Tco_1022288 [Tanacetum coccineum]
MGLPSTTSNEGTAKTTPRPEGKLGDKDSGGNKTLTNMGPIHPIVADLSYTGAKYQMFEPFIYLMMKLRKVRRTSWELVNRWMKILRLLQYNISLLHLRLTSLNHLLLYPLKHQTLTPLEKHEEEAVHYANLKASIDDYYEENIAHRDQTDKLVESSMRSLDKSSIATSDLYKCLNIITELLKEINNVVKDDPAMNKKISKATETFTKISTNITEVLSLVKGFDFSDLQSTVKDCQAHALKQDEELAAWAKSSTNMAWNLGSRLLVFKGQSSSAPSSSVTLTLALTYIPKNVEGGVELLGSVMASGYAQTIQSLRVGAEREGASEGEGRRASICAEALLRLVTLTLALTYIPKNVEGENEPNTATEDPPSYIKGETDVNKQEKFEELKHSTDDNIEFIGSSTPQPSVIQAQPITIINPEPIIPQREGKGIATDEHAEYQRKLVKASSIVRLDSDTLILVPYTINGKLFYLTAEQIDAYFEKEEKN